MLHQHFFASAVAIIHRAHLGDGYVTLVDQHQEIVRKVIEQGSWLLARFAISEVATIVFDPLHEASLLEHFQIVLSALTQALCLKQLAVRLEPLLTLLVLLPNLVNRPLNLLLRRCIVATRKDGKLRWLIENLASKRVDMRNSIHLISKKFHPIGRLLPCRKDIDYIALNAEGTARKIDIIAMVLDIHQLAQKFVLNASLTLAHRDG